MKPHPPPDQPCEEYGFRAEDVYLKTIGNTGDHGVEVLAHAGSMWMRFDLAKSLRLVRMYWKRMGHKKVKRGIVECPGGFGPYVLEGTVMGHDDEIDGAQDDLGKTLVLRDVKLTRQAEALHERS
jgi:hypothetical protein